MESQLVEECPICGNRQFTSELHLRDYAASHREFMIKSCTNCHLWLTNPRPQEQELAQYYTTSAYISHQKKSNSLLDTCYFLARRLMLHRKLRLIEMSHSKGRLLDYGCGTGAFLDLARRKGWQVCGYEPSLQARHAANPNLNIAATPTELSGQYDVITLWHVLEHIPHLIEDLQRISSLLKPGGLLIVAVPNRESWDADHYGSAWAGFDVPRHLWHFSRSNIAALFSNLQLSPLATKPLLLDSFYVSILSEQYLKTPAPLALVKGAFAGLWSNLAARWSGHYSSLIYFARK